jgi:carboxymethylenebutenolidase
MSAMRKLAACLLIVLSLVPPVDASNGKKVTFESAGLTLVGFLYQPEGDGPWPALIWNHGSEKDPGAGPQFDSVASAFVPAGYVVFAPERRGHGESPGDHIVDRLRFAFRQQGRGEGNRLMVRLMETEQLDDQLAALKYVQRLPFVDRERIVVAGCSYGGIQALLGAESRMGYRAALSISPAALSWDQNDWLKSRLIEAVGRTDIPVLLIQPAKDASLAPGRVLGLEAARRGKPLTVKVYPATGSAEEQSHCFGGARGMHVWASDAQAFFSSHLR